MKPFAAILLAINMAALPGAAQQPPSLAPLEPLPAPFALWLAGVRAEAATRGIRPEILEQAFAGVEPVEQILERDRAQAEFTLDLSAYLKRRLTRKTIQTAQEMYSHHRGLLTRIGKQYGVSPRIVVA